MEKISKSQVKLVKSLQLKKFRDELGLFVAEGDKCVSELAKSFELQMLIVEGENASRSDIEQMSGLKTPQGVIGVFRKPQMSNVQCQISNLTLALDGIQDPGNLGTIIRTCDWFGVHDIFCSHDTADCFNPKVVQATMGALARVHIHYVDLPEWLNDQMANDQMVNVFGTLLDGKNMYDVLTAKRSNSEAVSPLAAQRSIIVMGNEGNGISAPVRELITHPILIPSYPKNGAYEHSGTNEEASEVIESLNVSIATAIVLAEFRRV